LTKGILKVVVRGKKEPVKRIATSRTFYSATGVPLGSYVSFGVVYGTSFDRESSVAIDEARRISSRLCMELEVVRRGAPGLLRRAISSLAPRDRPEQTVVYSLESIRTTSSDASPGLDLRN